MDIPNFPGWSWKIRVAVPHLQLFRNNPVAAVGEAHPCLSDEMAAPYRGCRNYYSFQPGHGSEAVYTVQPLEEEAVDLLSWNSLAF